MLVIKFVDLSVVKLKDGREGTVVHIYTGGKGAELGAGVVEINDESHELVDVLPEDVERVLWMPTKAWYQKCGLPVDEGLEEQ